MEEKKSFYIDPKRYLKLIRENYSQILFLPILFGGLIQLINLLLISPQLVRFFSPTQAISDGLLLISVVIVFTIGVGIFVLFMTGYAYISMDHSRPKISEWEATHSKRHLMSFERFPKIVYLILLIVIIFMFINYFLRNFDIKLRDYEIDFIELLGVVPILVLFNFALTINIFGLVYKTKTPFVQDNPSKFISTQLVLNFIMILIYVSLSSTGTNVVANFEQLESKYSCLNSNEKARILYYNDQYIFIESTCSPNKIIVEKLDAIFDNRP